MIRIKCHQPYKRYRYIYWNNVPLLMIFFFSCHLPLFERVTLPEAPVFQEEPSLQVKG